MVKGAKSCAAVYTCKKHQALYTAEATWLTCIKIIQCQTRPPTYQVACTKTTNFHTHTHTLCCSYCHSMLFYSGKCKEDIWFDLVCLVLPSMKGVSSIAKPQVQTSTNLQYSSNTLINSNLPSICTVSCGPVAVCILDIASASSLLEHTWVASIMENAWER